jgi:hypothetical protein
MFRLLHEPVTSLVIAAAFALALLLRRGGATRALTITATLPVAAWLAFAIYEWRMLQWEKTVVAPIRLDVLLFIVPLVLVSLIGIAALIPRRR